MSNLELTVMIATIGVMLTISIWGWRILSILQDIQRTIAKLPTAMQTKQDIVVAPWQEAREGDVVFHLPTSLYGERS